MEKVCAKCGHSIVGAPRTYSGPDREVHYFHAVCSEVIALREQVDNLQRDLKAAKENISESELRERNRTLENMLTDAVRERSELELSFYIEGLTGLWVHRTLIPRAGYQYQTRYCASYIKDGMVIDTDDFDNPWDALDVVREAVKPYQKS